MTERWPRKVVKLAGENWTIIRVPGEDRFGLILGVVQDDKPEPDIGFRLEAGQVKIDLGASAKTQRKVLGGYALATESELDELEIGTEWATKKVWQEWSKLLGRLASDLNERARLYKAGQNSD